MLRRWLLWICMAGLVLTLIGPIAGWPVLPAAIPFALLMLVLLFERYIYKSIHSEPPDTDWERTAERFADPVSGQSVAVFYNPRTGERRYVADPDEP